MDSEMDSERASERASERESGARLAQLKVRPKKGGTEQNHVLPAFAHDGDARGEGHHVVRAGLRGP